MTYTPNIVRNNFKDYYFFFEDRVHAMFYDTSQNEALDNRKIRKNGFFIMN